MKFIAVDPSAYEFTYIETVGRFARESGEQQTDKDGVPFWELRVMVRSLAADGARPEIVPVKVPSLRPLGEVLTPFVQVELEGLTAFPWVIRDGRGADGIAFSASGVRMKASSKNGTKAAAEPVSAA